SLVIDTVAPSLSESYSGTAGSNGWYVATGSVTLTASDATSGVATTTYKLDGGASTSFTASFALSGDGTHTVVVTSTDVAGNSNSQSFTIKIDTLAPSVAESYSGTVGSNGWYVSTGSVTLTASDATSGVATTTTYKPDGAATTTYTAPLALSADAPTTTVVTTTATAST